MQGPIFLQEIDREQIANIERELKQLEDPKYRKDWRCGADGDYYWRMHGRQHMNDATFAELERQAKEAGWTYLVLRNGEDRGEYHCIEFHAKA